MERGLRRLRHDDEDEVVILPKRDDVQITQPLPAADRHAIQSRSVPALEIVEHVAPGGGGEKMRAWVFEMTAASSTRVFPALRPIVASSPI